MFAGGVGICENVQDRVRAGADFADEAGFRSVEVFEVSLQGGHARFRRRRNDRNNFVAERADRHPARVRRGVVNLRNGRLKKGQKLKTRKVNNV